MNKFATMQQIKDDSFSRDLFCGSLSISRDNNNNIQLYVKDNSSGVRILEVELDLESYALLISGLSEIKCVYRFVADESNISLVGKRKETKPIYCAKHSDSEAVQEHFNASGLADDGWSIWNDGTSSQQHGENHRYIVARWV